MRNETMEIGQAMSFAADFPFAWVHSVSQVTLGKNPGAPDLDELVEARYFDGNRELRIFPGETGFQALLLTGEQTDHTLTEIHAIQNTDRFGQSLTLCRVLDFDEDGQAFVKAVRLTDWKGESENG